MPETAERIAAQLGGAGLEWKLLGRPEGIGLVVEQPQPLFERLDKERIKSLRRRYSAVPPEQSAKRTTEGLSKDMPNEEEAPDIVAARRFSERVSLVAARVASIAAHPNADKLYVLQLDDGSGEERQIVSGLVGHYSANELAGRTIVLVANLKPAPFRGVRSRGMLLAASPPEQADQDEAEKSGGRKEIVEVLFVDHARPGTPILPHGYDVAAEYRRLDARSFFGILIEVRNHAVYVGDAPLECVGTALRTERVASGRVG